MKIVLIILVVLLIVAAIAFVVFKKIQLQRSQDDSISGIPNFNPRDRLNNTLGSNAHNEFNEQHEIPRQLVTNPLAVAESHLSNQNYPEAISALKNVLMTNPRHQGAMVKLLQAYGVTKQYEAFNQLHQKIHEIGDGETIREADFCKSLLDEELQAEKQAQALHSVANKAPAPTIDTLEFDIESETTSQSVRSTVPAPNNTQEELLDLDFDVSSNKAATANDDELLEFDDFNFDEPKTSQTQTAQADDSFGLDADFGFDEPKVESKPAPQANDGLNLDADFDFDPAPAKPAVDNALDLDNGFDFDPTPAPAVEPVKAQADDLSFGLDADFGFDEPKVESKPAPQANDGLNLDADFDFDPAPTPAPEVKTQADDLSFGLDADFGFDEPKVESKPAPQANDGLNLDADFDFDPAPAKPAVDNALDLDNGFDFDPTPAPAVEPVKAQADDLSFGLDADFGFDEPKVESKPAPQANDGLNLDADFDFDPAPAKPAVDNALDLDNGFDFDPTPAPAVEPVKAQADDLSFGLDADFGFDEPKVESKPAPQANDGLNLDADFDFDPAPAKPAVDNALDLDNGFDFDPTPAPAVEPVKAQADDLSFGLDADFGFDEPKVESKPAPQANDGLNLDADFDFDPAPAKPAVDNALDLDNGFDFDPTPAPAVEPVKAQADDLSFGLDNDFGFEEPKAPTPQVDDSLNLDAIPAVTIASQAVTSSFDDDFGGVSDNQEIPSEIGFVSTLDNAQITLDLAKQYLEFGEYESAKHLLNEVVKTGNEEQRQDAINTIKRLG